MSVVFFLVFFCIQCIIGRFATIFSISALKDLWLVFGLQPNCEYKLLSLNFPWFEPLLHGPRVEYVLVFLQS